MRIAPTLAPTLAVLFGAVLVGAANAPEALALDRDVKTVLIAGGYGLAGGTIVGLATLPIHQDVKGIFVGSSIGLYVGVVVGIFHVFNRKDPQNPLSEKTAFAPLNIHEPPRLIAAVPYRPEGVWPGAEPPELKLALKLVEF